MDDVLTVRTVDMKHLKEDGVSSEDVAGLHGVLRHEDVRVALSDARRTDEAAAALAKKSKWTKPKKDSTRGWSVMKVWEAKQLLADGPTLLDAEKKASVPAELLEPQDQVNLHGRAPGGLAAHNQLDVDSLAFVLSASLAESKKPWERGDDPYDKTRLKTVLEKKIKLDQIQARLSEIEALEDTKLGPEYNYLRMKGRHTFHVYLDDLAKLRRDLIAGLVEESASEWDAFEAHETRRAERIVARYSTLQEEPAAAATSTATAAAAAAAGEPSAEDAGEDAAPEAAAAAESGDATKDAAARKKKKKKTKTKASAARERERRFKQRMEREEVEGHLRAMRAECEEDSVRDTLKGVEAEEAAPKLLWGTLPPGREHLEYQAHVAGSSAGKGWAWQRPVYYVPQIPWREAAARRAKAEKKPYPFVVDDMELPMDWEVNYRHFPYFKRQELWENPGLVSPVCVDICCPSPPIRRPFSLSLSLFFTTLPPATKQLPSTEPDWPHREKDFLDIYLSKHDFVHPGDWDVKLGRKRRSKYKTLQKTIFENRFEMSPFESSEFEQYMDAPEQVCRAFTSSHSTTNGNKHTHTPYDTRRRRSIALALTCLDSKLKKNGPWKNASCCANHTHHIRRVATTIPLPFSLSVLRHRFDRAEKTSASQKKSTILALFMQQKKEGKLSKRNTNCNPRPPLLLILDCNCLLLAPLPQPLFIPACRYSSQPYSDDNACPPPARRPRSLYVGRHRARGVRQRQRLRGGGVLQTRDGGGADARAEGAAGRVWGVCAAVGQLPREGGVLRGGGGVQGAEPVVRAVRAGEGGDGGADGDADG